MDGPFWVALVRADEAGNTKFYFDTFELNAAIAKSSDGFVKDSRQQIGFLLLNQEVRLPMWLRIQTQRQFVRVTTVDAATLATQLQQRNSRSQPIHHVLPLLKKVDG